MAGTTWNPTDEIQQRLEAGAAGSGVPLQRRGGPPMALTRCSSRSRHRRACSRNRRFISAAAADNPFSRISRCRLRRARYLPNRRHSSRQPGQRFVLRYCNVVNAPPQSWDRSSTRPRRRCSRHHADRQPAEQNCNGRPRPCRTGSGPSHCRHFLSARPVTFLSRKPGHGSFSGCVAMAPYPRRPLRALHVRHNTCTSLSVRCVRLSLVVVA